MTSELFHDLNRQLIRKGYIKMEMLDYLKHCTKDYMKHYIERKDLNYCEGLNHNWIFMFPDPIVNYDFSINKDARLDQEDVMTTAVWQYLDQIIRKEFIMGSL